MLSALKAKLVKMKTQFRERAGIDQGIIVKIAVRIIMLKALLC